MQNFRRNNHFSERRTFQRGYSHARRMSVKKLNPALFVKKANVSSVSLDNQAAPLSSAKFSEYEISDKLKRNIADRGYTTPTAIQEKAIPYVLAMRDVIGVANTGTGKTAAFLTSLLNKAYHDRNQRVLIVVPTRELAQQIIDEFHIFSRGMDLDAALCIGGANIQRQEKRLYHKPHFVIGTPGRLKDFIKRRTLDLMLFQNVVLDEVDRMVDIGFIRDIEYLISLLPKKRQSLFFSATVSGKVLKILQSFVTDPITVSVKQQETAENIEQDVIRVKDRAAKIDVLHDLLIKEEFQKVLIFGQTKWGVEKLTKSLIARGFRAAAIHGNKSQGQRQRALQQFKGNELHVLLATDVASRGLDIDDVSHVINYDAPLTYEDYVHRIGRTGRAGKKETALTFVE